MVAEEEREAGAGLVEDSTAVEGGRTGADEGAGSCEVGVPLDLCMKKAGRCCQGKGRGVKYGWVLSG